MLFAAVPLGPQDDRRESFFGDRELDESLPSANSAFWAALISHIEDEALPPPRTILDVGCHSGGLLTILGDRFPGARLFGIEPVAPLRAAAIARLGSRGADGTVLGANGWDDLESGSIDLLVCHEVLYLIPDLGTFMEQLRQALSSEGRAFLVLGCHAENPVWTAWRKHFDAKGIPVFDHRPFNILAAASAAGMIADLQPLRRAGWISYDPAEATFPFPDAQTMFDHHYRHKLIFRLRLDDGSASCPS